MVKYYRKGDEKMRNDRKDLRHNIKKTATCAVLSALTVTLLFIGGIIEIFDMTAAAIASVAIIIAFAEFGTGSALSVYAVSSVLSFILFPMSGSAMYFALVMGYYPVFKFYADKKLKNKLVRIISKFAVFNLASTLELVIFMKLYGTEALMADFAGSGISFPYVLLILYAVLNVFLVMYDLLILYVFVIYKKVLRKRIFPEK